MNDLIIEHIFKNDKFASIKETDYNNIKKIVIYYNEYLLCGTPYLFLYYLDKLDNCIIFNITRSKYLFLIALFQLTTKWAEDIYVSNNYILNLFFGNNKYLKSLKKMELHIFAALDYNLYVSNEIYQEYCISIDKKYNISTNQT